LDYISSSLYSSAAYASTAKWNPSINASGNAVLNNPNGGTTWNTIGLNGSGRFAMVRPTDSSVANMYIWKETVAGTPYYTTVIGDEPVHEHTAAEAVKENEVAATCTEAGSYDMVVYCTVCGEELSRESFTVDALGHDWGEWEVTTPATCTAEGVETRTCARCGATETRPIAMVEHTPGEAVKENNVEPTCTEAGSYDMVVYCTVCGEELSRETVKVDAIGHDYGEPTWTWAEDYSTASTTFTCSHDESHKVTLAADVTSETDEAAQQITYTATVTFEGETYIDTKTVDIPVTGHHINVIDYTFDAATNSIEADTLYTGETTFTVACDKACIVLLQTGENTYEVLPCSTVGETHSFTVTVGDDDVTVVIAIRGDANLDGTVDLMDATMIKQLDLGRTVNFKVNEAIQRLTGDATGDGLVNIMDSTLIKQLDLGMNKTIKW
jgi:hypothetical protein